MSIFWPDNDKRKARVVQLGTDAQNFLKEAKSDYETFKTLCVEANEKIAELYETAKLSPPSTTMVDILEKQKAVYDINTDQTIVEITNILLGLAGVGAVSYFAPAATAVLIDAGVISEETAEIVLFSVLGFEMTAGGLGGAVLAGIVVGVIAFDAYLWVDFFEGEQEMEKLRAAINQTASLRLQVRIALDKSKAVVGVLQSIITTCKTLQSSGIELTGDIIQSLIEKDALPSLNALQAVDPHSVGSELVAFDVSRHAWMVEDPRF